MIRLTQPTTDLLRVSASSTNAIQIVASYSEKTATAYIGKTAVLAKSTTAIQDIIATPASGSVYDVDHLTFYCAAANTLTPSVTVSGTAYPVGVFTLAAGDTLEYTHAGGWRVLNSAGAVTTYLPGYLPLTGGTVSGAITLSAALTYGGVTLTNAVTGTGKMVLDTSPTIATPIINSAAHVGGTWVADATWTLPAVTLGGAVTVPTGVTITGAGTAAITGFTSVSATTGTFTNIGGFALTGGITSATNQAINIGSGALTAGAISGSGAIISTNSMYSAQDATTTKVTSVAPERAFTPGVSKTFTFVFGNGILFQIANNGSGTTALGFASYASATVTFLTGSAAEFVNSSTPGASEFGVFKSAGTGTISFKTGSGYSTAITLTVFGTVSSVTDPA